MKTFNLGDYDQINLIAVDVQNDFCPGGSLAVEEGDLVVPALNRVMRAMQQSRGQYWTGRDYYTFENQIIATRDWHPPQTSHFAEEPNFKTTWPVHCVAGTNGAAFHPELALTEHAKSVEVVSKGTRTDEDAYSGFDGHNVLRLRLEALLNPNRKRTALIVGGLATDYCVKATVLDARNLGYETFVLEDGIKGVNPETARQAIEEMAKAGAAFVTTDSIIEAYDERKL